MKIRVIWRMTLDASALQKLGTFVDQFNGRVLHEGLRKCSQPIKTKLLDQSLLAGVGNIYASESLWRRNLASQTLPALSAPQCDLLAHDPVGLGEAIEAEARCPWIFPGGEGDGLFYYGGAPDAVRREI